MFLTKNKSKAFTLIELLVVVAIIGILASVVMSAVNSARSKARDAVRISDIKQIQSALERYYIDNGAYPIRGWTHSNNSSAWSAFGSSLSPYINELPVDPLNEDTTDNGHGPSAYYGDSIYSYYANGYGGPGKWYMIVFNLENNNLIETYDGVQACNGWIFHYGGGPNTVTVGGSCVF